MLNTTLFIRARSRTSLDQTENRFGFSFHSATSGSVSQSKTSGTLITSGVVLAVGSFRIFCSDCLMYNLFRDGLSRDNGNIMPFLWQIFTVGPTPTPHTSCNTILDDCPVHRIGTVVFAGYSSCLPQ